MIEIFLILLEKLIIRGKKVILVLNLRYGWDFELIYKVYIKIISISQLEKFDQS